MWPGGSLARKLQAWFGTRKDRAFRARENAKRRGLPHRDQHYTGPFADGPWGDIERALAYHRPESTPRQHLNRLAQEQALLLGEPAPPWLDENSCTADYEDWPVARLAELPRLHGRDVPRDEAGPLILLAIGDRTGLLDGHTRVNKWTKEGAGGSRRVIVIRPKRRRQDGAGQTPRSH